MRKLLVLLFLLSFGTAAYCEEKAAIGFVDLQRALNECEVGKKTKTELEDMIKRKQAEIDEKINKRDTLEQELDKQSSILSEEAAKKRMDELEKLQREIDRDISDSNAEVQKIQREKELVILRDLDDIISSLGAERGLAVILPADVILYAAEGIDLTDMVIERYDALARERSGGGKKGAKEPAGAQKEEKGR